MADGDLEFNTKYGKVKMTSPTSSGRSSAPKAGEMRLGGVFDNPFNTFGLASKSYVNKMISEHTNDEGAHKKAIGEILSRIERIEKAIGLKK